MKQKHADIIQGAHAANLGCICCSLMHEVLPIGPDWRELEAHTPHV